LVSSSSSSPTLFTALHEVIAIASNNNLTFVLFKSINDRILIEVKNTLFVWLLKAK